jgi:hypothetical protein
MTKTSLVFSGDNVHKDWKPRDKSNEGHGMISGDHNTVSENCYVINDPDVAGQVSGEKKA